METTDRILDRLERVCRQVSGWWTSCPAHEEGDHGFSPGGGEDGKPLHCFAGCSVEVMLRMLAHGHGGLWTLGRAS